MDNALVVVDEIDLSGQEELGKPDRKTVGSVTAAMVIRGH